MEQTNQMNGVSVIVPTRDRSELLERLLVSLDRERLVYPGPIEIVVVDSSEGSEKEAIVQSCLQHDALYFEGDKSVRRKRNLAVEKSSHELLLFLDSDVVAEPGLVQAHVDAYSGRDYVGGVQGLTTFVGRDTFLWNCVKRSALIGSFDNAAKYPFQSWSITNNLSVKKSLFNEIGGFLEDLPFDLGGDDLEMSYRISRTGKLIASAPEAVALHTKQTWNSLHAILDRTKRWGTMEGVVCELHPELYRYVIPRNYVFEALLLATILFCAACFCSLPLVILACMMLVLFAAQRWIKEMLSAKAFLNPVFLLFGALINARYELFRILGYLRKGHRGVFMHGLVFNHHQVMGYYGPDSARLWLMLFDWAVALIAARVILYV